MQACTNATVKLARQPRCRNEAEGCSRGYPIETLLSTRSAFKRVHGMAQRVSEDTQAEAELKRALLDKEAELRRSHDDADQCSTLQHSRIAGRCALR
jgi:hypothetical protein